MEEDNIILADTEKNEAGASNSVTTVNISEFLNFDLNCSKAEKRLFDCSNRGCDITVEKTGGGIVLKLNTGKRILHRRITAVSLHDNACV